LLKQRAMQALERTRVGALAVELTALCNQKCGYCYNGWREDAGKSVGSADGEQLLQRLRRVFGAWEVDHVTLTGGEPLLHPQLFEVIELCESNGVGVQIISNGGMVTEGTAAQLGERRLRFIQVTLNGPDAELHERHVGPGHFEKTLRGVRLLQQARVPVVGCVVVTRLNARRVGEILGLWRSLGVEHVAFSRFSPAGYAVAQVAELLPSREDLIAALEQAHAFASAGMLVSSTMPIPPCAVEIEQFPRISFGFCAVGSGEQELALSPTGQLRHCTLHRGTLFGGRDVLDESLDLASVPKSDEILSYKREVPELCRGCVHEHTCGGGCGAAAEWVLGHARRFPDPLVQQYLDDDLAAKLAEQRLAPRRLPVLQPEAP
jgi:radical SAM protein with 4Fe4S-binding SPASM domain